jgi:ribosomal protein S18 acetylase RimI-like enzyme
MRRRTAAVSLQFVAREFKPSRWADFEALFQKYHGVQAGCWCMYYHRTGPTGPLSSSTRQEANRRDHRALLLRGHAQGVLVYREDQPVGWCQFGRRGDLPRIENGRKYKQLGDSLGNPPRWRITCFFVDRPYRRSGIARLALHEALASIARRGGGVVEAYPATRGNAVATWFGTVGMFEREGFRKMVQFGQSNVLVRKEVPATRGSYR